MIALTGATGQLGHLVLEQLLSTAPASQVVAIVRNPAKAADLVQRGVTVRAAAYAEPDALVAALAGVKQLLLIASSEIGQRVAQHRNVIHAARKAGVQRLVFTSLLHADRSPLSLAGEYRETEAAIRDSGLPSVILRNGWYTENYTVSVRPAVAHGALLGSAGTGWISSAARADYAAAAAKALTGGAEVGRIYELAGDFAFTLSELAAEISRQSGREVPYRNLPESEYRDALRQAGLPAEMAAAFAAWDVDASRGALFDEGRELSRLIGRPTTPLAESVRRALRD